MFFLPVSAPPRLLLLLLRPLAAAACGRYSPSGWEMPGEEVHAQGEHRDVDRPAPCPTTALNTEPDVGKDQRARSGWSMMCFGTAESPWQLRALSIGQEPLLKGCCDCLLPASEPRLDFKGYNEELLQTAPGLGAKVDVCVTSCVVPELR